MELGGAIEVVAYLTDKRLEHPQKHVVVKAIPNLIPYLKRELL